MRKIFQKLKYHTELNKISALEYHYTQTAYLSSYHQLVEPDLSKMCGIFECLPKELQIIRLPVLSVYRDNSSFVQHIFDKSHHKQQEAIYQLQAQYYHVLEKTGSIQLLQSALSVLEHNPLLAIQKEKLQLEQSISSGTHKRISKL